MSGPLVSIVTPTLNQARFLEATLRSVRSQTYRQVEHIVVDGGSSDGTLDLLRKAEAAGQLQFVSEPDEGMYDAINKGLRMATGEVIGYLNSDDAYFPWALDTVMALFERRPDIELVYGDGVKVDEATGSQRLRLFAPFDRVSLANYESLMQPAVFWRRSLSERIGGFDSGKRYVADLDYWLRAAAAGAGIAHVDEVIAVERIHEARLSSAHQAAMAEEDSVMRAAHAGDQGGQGGRERARQRDAAWQRRLFARFVLASWLRWIPSAVPRPLRHAWPRFLRDGRVSVRWWRALRSAPGRRRKQLVDVVVSGLAADVLQ